MATTFELIKGATLTGSQASYTFSAIPSTFTDLCLKMSCRTNDSGSWQSANNITVNGLTSGYSMTQLRGNYTAPDSVRNSSQTTWHDINQNAVNSTSNTFSNDEVYFPSYTASQNKPVSIINVLENNHATNFWINADAALLSNTAAISSITITASGSSFVAGSSFYLYGVKNA